MSGEYFAKRRVKTPSPAARDDQRRREVVGNERSDLVSVPLPEGEGFVTPRSPVRVRRRA